MNTDGYSLWGGSAGARMAAWVGSYGTAAFGADDLPRPAAVIMQYTGLSEYSESDPATFVTVGESDGIANWRVMKQRLDGMSALGIDTEFHSYPGLSHGFGLGTGTVAEGWINEAIAFLLMSVMVFMLAACGNTGNVQNNDVRENKEQISEEQTIDVSESETDENTGPRPADASNVTAQADVPMFTLNNGVQMPQLGLGTQIRRLENDASEGGSVPPGKGTRPWHQQVFQH